MSKVGTVHVDVDADWHRFRKNTNTAMSKMRGTIGSAFRVGLGVIGAQAVAAVSRQLLEMGKDALTFASELEVATLAFEQLDPAGLKVLEHIKELAKTTPFEVKPLIEGTRKMIGYGVEAERAGRLMDVVVDNVAAFGGTDEHVNRVSLALGQVQAKGRVLGEELRQLNESGVQAQAALADYLGVSQGEILEMARKGKISVEDLYGALESLSGPLEKNAGFAEKASDSVVGAASNMKDAWNIAIADSMLPLMEGLKETIKDELTPAIEDAARTMGPIFARGVTVLSAVFAAILPVLSSFAELIAEVATLIGEQLVMIMPVLTPLLQALFDVIGQVIAAVLPILRDLLADLAITIIPVLVSVLELFLDAIVPLLPTLGDLIAVVVELAAGVLADFLAALLPVVAVLLEELLPVIVELVDGPLNDFWEAFKPILDILGDLITGPLLDLVKKLLPPLAELFAALAPLVVAIVEVVAEWAGAMLDVLIPILDDLIDSLLPALTDILDLLTVLLVDNKDSFIRITEAMLPVVTIIGDLTGFVITLMDTAIIPLLDAAGDLATFLIDKFAGAIEEVMGWFESLNDIISGVLSYVETFLIDFEGTLTGWLSTAVDWGKDVIQGMIDGMGAVASRISQWVKDNILSKITSTVKGWFGISSPSKQMMGFGENIVEGLNIGMAKTAPNMSWLPDVAGLSDNLDVGDGLMVGAVRQNFYAPVVGDARKWAEEMERERAIAALFSYA